MASLIKLLGEIIIAFGILLLIIKMLGNLEHVLNIISFSDSSTTMPILKSISGSWIIVVKIFQLIARCSTLEFLSGCLLRYRRSISTQFQVSSTYFGCISYKSYKKLSGPFLPADTPSRKEKENLRKTKKDRH